jgi:hypothetical protein
VLLSNLGLTAFVKHQVNWLNRFCSLPSGGKKKRQNHRSLFFAPYQNKSLQILSLSLSLSLFIESIYASQDIYGDKNLLYQEFPSMPLKGTSFWPYKPSWLL